MENFRSNIFSCPKHTDKYGLPINRTHIDYTFEPDCWICFQVKFNFGQLGDAVIELDKWNYNRLSNKEKDLLSIQEKEEDIKLEKEAYIDTVKTKTTDNRTGELKYKWLYPCRHYCFKGDFGVKEPAYKHFKEGCEAHDNGRCCPFIHDDELGWKESEIEFNKDKTIKKYKQLDVEEYRKGNLVEFKNTNKRINNNTTSNRRSHRG